MHVVSAHWNESLDWLKQSEFKYTIVDKADNPNRDPDSTLHVEFNRGRETSAYLKYIITHYNELPERVAFIHGHDTSKHQSRPTLQALRECDPGKDFESLDRFCGVPWPGAVLYNQARMSFPLFFAREEWVKLLNMGPIVVCNLGAQFCVHRERIHRLPLAAWESLYDDVMLDPNDYCKGVVAEYMWHILMGENAAMWCALKHIRIDPGTVLDSPIIRCIPAVVVLIHLKYQYLKIVIILIFMLVLRYLLMNHELLRLWNPAHGAMVPFTISFPEEIPTTPTLFVMTHDEATKGINEDIAALVDFVSYMERETGRKSSVIVHSRTCHKKLFSALRIIGNRDITLLWQPAFEKHDAIRALKRGRNVVILVAANKGLESERLQSLISSVALTDAECLIRTVRCKFEDE